MSRFFIFCIYIGLLSKATAIDPCRDYTIMNDKTRSASYLLPESESEKCDRILQTGWYRLQIDNNDSEMASTCINVFSCGSSRPIWLNGTLPIKIGQQIKGSMCYRGFLNCCEKTAEVEIMNCGTFNVYYWTPIDLCQGRYCVAERVRCKPGFSSETGFEPGCRAINITYNEIPTIGFLPINQDFNVMKESMLRFQCKVKVPLKNTGNVFDIQWYLNGREVQMRQNIPERDLGIKSIFTKDDLIKLGQKTVGFKIKCSVRARVFSGETPTPFVESNEFYAGIVVKTTSLTINAGADATILIHSTVPIFCGMFQNRNLPCAMRFEMLDQRKELESTTKEQFCKSKTRTNSSNLCGISFDGWNWNKDQKLTIPTRADQTIHRGYTAVVKLLSRGIDGRDPLWISYELPDIKIRIRENDYIPAKCSSVTDPHIITFDGKSYTSFEEGEYVLYKHTRKPIAVHAIHKSLGSAALWNCAVAVRAGSDVFMVYGCDKRWRQRRAFCDKIHGSYLDVYEKNQGKHYEVHLPTGARVSIFINNNGNGKHLDIYIDASTLDKENTAGLCGTFNDNRNDDFKSPIGKVVSELEFKRSWHVDTVNSLFVAKARAGVIEREQYVCSCVNSTDNDGTFDTTADCNWDDSVPVCTSPSFSEQQCKYRYRRDLDDEDEDDIDISPEIVAYKPAPSNIDTWKNGWNESAALQECTNVLHKSEMYQKCKNIITFNESQSIQICVEDIKYLGTNQLTSEVDKPIREACLNLLRINETMWQPATNESTATPSPITNIVTSILEKDCPNDCSVQGIKQGNCQNGKCSCFANFVGDDCSIDTMKAPEIDASDTDTVCDTNKKACSSVRFFGDNFFNSGSGFKCKLEEMKVSNNTDTSSISMVHLTDADMISFGEIRCYLPTSRRKRSISISQPEGFLVSVTTNGNTFSNQLPVIVYDSTCSNCAIINGGISCTAKDDICIVNGQCYSLSNTKCASRVEKEQGQLWIIGAVLGGVTFVLIVVFLIVKVINAPRTRTDLVRMPAIPDYRGNKPMNYK